LVEIDIAAPAVIGREMKHGGHVSDRSRGNAVLSQVALDEFNFSVPDQIADVLNFPAA
jgi:hypothetical protein